jgi:hypothetical protein
MKIMVVEGRKRRVRLLVSQCSERWHVMGFFEVCQDFFQKRLQGSPRSSFTLPIAKIKQKRAMMRDVM